MRAFLALAALLAACQPAADPPDTSATDPPPTSAAPAAPAPSVGPGVPLDALVSDAVDGGALRDRLAEPLRTEAEPVENRHVPGQIDTVRTYVYDHVRVRFYDRSGGEPLLERVTLTGGDARTAEGVGIGSTPAEVEAAYGPPVETVDGERAYEIGEGPAPIRLLVRYDDGAAGRLTWYPYVD